MAILVTWGNGARLDTAVDQGLDVIREEDRMKKHATPSWDVFLGSLGRDFGWSIQEGINPDAAAPLQMAPCPTSLSLYLQLFHPSSC